MNDLAAKIARAREHDRQVQHELHSCVSFNGIQHDECKAGVNYRRLIGGPDFGWAKHLPCLNDPEAVQCEKRAFPTLAEAETIVTEMDEATAAVIRHLADGTPLPPGVSVMVCQQRDMEPWSSGDDEP